MISTALAAASGALLQEIVWWYNIRRNLDTPDRQRLFRDAKYWTVVALFIAAAALVSVFWFEDPDPRLRDVLVFGAFLPLALKSAGKAAYPGEAAENASKPWRVLVRRYLDA